MPSSVSMHRMSNLVFEPTFVALRGRMAQCPQPIARAALGAWRAISSPTAVLPSSQPASLAAFLCSEEVRSALEPLYLPIGASALYTLFERWCEGTNTEVITSVRMGRLLGQSALLKRTTCNAGRQYQATGPLRAMWAVRDAGSGGVPPLPDTGGEKTVLGPLRIGPSASPVDAVVEAHLGPAHPFEVWVKAEVSALPLAQALDTLSLWLAHGQRGPRGLTDKVEIPRLCCLVTSFPLPPLDRIAFEERGIGVLSLEGLAQG